MLMASQDGACVSSPNAPSATLTSFILLKLPGLLAVPSRFFPKGLCLEFPELKLKLKFWNLKLPPPFPSGFLTKETSPDHPKK